MEKIILALNCVQDRMNEIISHHPRLQDEAPDDAMVTGGVSWELDCLRQAKDWLESAMKERQLVS